jgi:hypothetical protein
MIGEIFNDPSVTPVAAGASFKPPAYHAVLRVRLR